MWLTQLRKHIIYSENNFLNLAGKYLENEYLIFVLKAFKLWKKSNS